MSLSPKPCPVCIKHLMDTIECNCHVLINSAVRLPKHNCRCSNKIRWRTLYIEGFLKIDFNLISGGIWLHSIGTVRLVKVDLNSLKTATGTVEYSKFLIRKVGLSLERVEHVRCVRAEHSARTTAYWTKKDTKDNTFERPKGMFST